MPSPAALFGSILFGLVGMAAFVYGKRLVLWRPMVIGVGLMVFPYFVGPTWLLYTIGGVLCVGLYLFRD